MTSLRIRAHAKINLHLGIGGLRPDGYHDVETVLQTLALHDTLTVEAHDGPFALASDRPDVPVDASNLVWRAAALLATAVGRDELMARGTRIAIEKRIPLQAGLGGGSADAAAALLALVRFWRVDVDGQILRGIGSRLGADVPFFFEGGTALGVGRGDEVRPLPDFPASAVVVVMPPFGVPTADAYRWHDARVASLANPGVKSLAAPRAAAGRWPAHAEQWREWLGRCRNDFEVVVGERYADVPATIARLKGLGATLAALSGSGAAMFGVFADDGMAEAAVRSLDRPGWRVFASRTLDRASYWR